MLSSYKTSVSAILSAAASFVLFAPQVGMTFPKWATALAMFVSIGGLAALGIEAKDYNVTGGTVQTGTQTSATPQAAK